MSFLKTARGLATKVPSNLKGKSKSSQEWITRQLTDPYVERAKVGEADTRVWFVIFMKLLLDDELPMPVVLQAARD